MTSSKCRLCLSNDSSVNIFDDNDSDIPLQTKIIVCVAVTVMMDDPHPKKICSSCYNLINSFHDFRETCLQSLITLENYLDDTPSENLNENETEKANSILVKSEEIRVNEKDKVCKFCKRTFKSSTMLKYHLMVHTGEKPHHCHLCKRKFRLPNQLKFHLKIHTGSSPYRCDICQKVVLRPSDLIKHKRKHTGERPFACLICNKKFSQLCGLKTHSRLHTNERPYKCSFCSKTFIQYVNKAKHEKIHEDGKKPYVCDVPHCGRSFIDSSEQKLHRAGHNGGRPRKCDHCGLGFRTPSHLRDHIRRFHTNERPYTCDLCDKKFWESHGLKLHKIVHDSQKPFQCRLCPQTFSQSGNYKRHMSSKHEIMDATDNINEGES